MVDAMVPLAPLRFSTTTDWPSSWRSLSATRRAMKSTAGPGGTGTTIVIGLAVGQACAAAPPPVLTIVSTHSRPVTACEMFIGVPAGQRSATAIVAWRQADATGEE